MQSLYRVFLRVLKQYLYIIARPTLQGLSRRPSYGRPGGQVVPRGSRGSAKRGSSTRCFCERFGARAPSPAPSLLWPRRACATGRATLPQRPSEQIRIATWACRVGTLQVWSRELRSEAPWPHAFLARCAAWRVGKCGRDVSAENSRVAYVLLAYVELLPQYAAWAACNCGRAEWAWARCNSGRAEWLERHAEM